MQSVVKSLTKLLFATPLLRAVLLLAFGFLLGFIAWSSWTNAIRYSLAGQQTTVTVEKYTPGKAWTGTAEVTYAVDGQTIKARMQTWAYSVQPGEQVGALYLLDQPRIVTPDSWWRFVSPLLSSVLPALFLVGGLCFGVQDIRRMLRSGEEPVSVDGHPAATTSTERQDTGTVEYPLSKEGFPVEPSGVPIEPGAALEVGSKVLAYEEDRWWRAEVVEVQPDDMVRIHFPGWDPRWDKSVAKNALQRDMAGNGDIAGAQPQPHAAADRPRD
jgi:hypothetical protein